MEKRCVNFIVAGRVQGVSYRAATLAQAEALGITGWVQNLTDGRVAVLACGTEQQLQALQQWLWHGPQLAQVNEVEMSKATWQECDSFIIKR